MDRYEDDDEYDDLLLLDDLFDFNDEDETDQNAKKYEQEPVTVDMSEVYAENYEELSREIGDEIVEYDYGEFNVMINLNKELMSSMLELKRSVVSALHKCERKLNAVDTCLEKYAQGDAKVMACNAGMPYFKDRSYFFAPNNEDTLIKEARGEIQIDGLPKVCSWTTKERSTLLKAIRQEAVTNVLHLEDLENSDSDEMGSNQEFLPQNFKEMVGPLGSKKFDWFKISVVHFKDRHPPTDCQGMWNSFLHPDINKSPWKKLHDNKLKMIAKKYNYQDWDKISKELGTNRTAYQCFIRYNTTKKLPTITNCTWDPEEDKTLMKLVELFKIGDFVPWGEVASWMNNRTKPQTYYRWTYSLTPYLIKGRFTKLEDNVLREGVAKYGKNFAKISAALMPNRSTVQLSYRYDRLAVDKKEHPNLWSAEDDKKLVRLFEQLGPNWSTIATLFAGKTRTQLRHRYASIQRRNLHTFTLSTVDSDEETEDSIGVSPVYNNGTLHRSEDFNDNVDKEIIEYFRATRMAEHTSHTVQFYDTEELNDNVKKLYDILQLLDARLNIPENIDDVQLSYAERQLLFALIEYIRVQSDEKRKLRMMEECSLIMFGLNHEERGNSHFIPPLPYDSRVKLKKDNHTQVINYNLNENNNFLLDESPEIFTPDYVISSIGGEEQEQQFQSLNRLLGYDGSKYTKRNTVRKLYILSPNILNQNNIVKRIANVNGNSLRNGKLVHHSKTLIKKDVKHEHENAKISNNIDQELDRRQHVPFSLLEDPSYHPPVPYVEVTMNEEREKENPAMETTYATLQSFKNLMYYKRLYEPKKTNINVKLNVTDANAFQDACILLETRLERLFKYPAGLARTELPQLYDTDTFSYDNVKPKRKLKRYTQNGGKRMKI